MQNSAAVADFGPGYGWRLIIQSWVPAGRRSPEARLGPRRVVPACRRRRGSRRRGRSGDSTPRHTASPPAPPRPQRAGRATGWSRRDGGMFTFGNAQLLRLDRRHAPEPADRRHGPHAFRATATGSSRVTAGCSASATRTSTARPAAMHLNQPIVGMARTPSGKRLLARRERRWDVQLRRRAVPRLDRWHAPEPADRRHGADAVGSRLLARRARRWDVHASATRSSTARPVAGT